MIVVYDGIIYVDGVVVGSVREYMNGTRRVTLSKGR